MCARSVRGCAQSVVGGCWSGFRGAAEKSRGTRERSWKICIFHGGILGGGSDTECRTPPKLVAGVLTKRQS